MTLREDYPAGRKFRVVREGGYLFGMAPLGSTGGFTGTRRDLHVGDVIETTGFGAGWGSDPGYGIHFKDAEARWAEFKPSTGGAFAYQPAPGYLEPLA
jgi:hypothetical protein